MNTLCIDIGGTKFSMAVFEGEKILARESRATRPGGRTGMDARPDLRDRPGVALDLQIRQMRYRLWRTRELRSTACGVVHSRGGLE